MLPHTWESNLKYAREELERLRDLADQATSEMLELRLATENSVVTSLALMSRVDQVLAGIGSSSVRPVAAARLGGAIRLR